MTSEVCEGNTSFNQQSKDVQPPINSNTIAHMTQLLTQPVNTNTTGTPNPKGCSHPAESLDCIFGKQGSSHLNLSRSWLLCKHSYQKSHKTFSGLHLHFWENVFALGHQFSIDSSELQITQLLPLQSMLPLGSSPPESRQLKSKLFQSGKELTTEEILSSHFSQHIHVFPEGLAKIAGLQYILWLLSAWNYLLTVLNPLLSSFCLRKIMYTHMLHHRPTDAKVTDLTPFIL